jgi:hypothetical protein
MLSSGAKTTISEPVVNLIIYAVSKRITETATIKLKATLHPFTLQKIREVTAGTRRNHRG